MNTDKIASDIYQRLEMNEQNSTGSVSADIADMSIAEMEDYFGDTDPSEYL